MQVCEKFAPGFGETISSTIVVKIRVIAVVFIQNEGASGNPEDCSFPVG
jgi:hypothetical protein